MLTKYKAEIKSVIITSKCYIFCGKFAYNLQICSTIPKKLIHQLRRPVTTSIAQIRLTNNGRGRLDE